MSLSNSCVSLPGVGPTLASKLERCGIYTIQDLLFHLPYRYQDRTRITPIQDLQANHWAVIVAKIIKTEIKPGKKALLHCHVSDNTGILKIQFFHFNKQQLQQMNNSDRIYAFGEVKVFKDNMIMTHPEYQLLNENQVLEVNETLTPIYSSTQGLSQNRLRQMVHIALETYEHDLQQLEWMTEEDLKQQQLSSLLESLILLHNPPPDTSLECLEQGQHPALRRVVFDELLAHRLSMQFARQSREQLHAPIFEDHSDLKKTFIRQLPFTLTKAQQRVLIEISQDLTRNKPMLRLVQGDVGSGKTIIAAIAAIQVIAKGYQVAFMAPTDLLSEQHTLNLQQWFTSLGIVIKRLSGKMKRSARQQVLEDLKTGTCHIAIGTHALFQEEVQFANLGLVIIDEQHRFGVEQRLLLQNKGTNQNLRPHQLLMTATPIPRTLCMTHLAHLDVSLIDELPPGRTPISTVILGQAKRELLIERLQVAITEGRQIYWVCTLIEESETLQCMAAIDTAHNLQQLLPTAKIGLVHGRLKNIEKESIMANFKAGLLDLLVATTVIEVGVDVPNASLMIIENAERLGLSQLHQLRGRVGRGSIQSHCLLLYQKPLSNHGMERLKIMRATNNGFVIAEKDLQLRGAGQLLGVKQTGYRQFKVANLERDKALLANLPVIAKKLLALSPDVAHHITKRWLQQYEHFLQA